MICEDRIHCELVHPHAVLDREAQRRIAGVVDRLAQRVKLLLRCRRLQTELGQNGLIVIEAGDGVLAERQSEQIAIVVQRVLVRFVGQLADPALVVERIEVIGGIVVCQRAVVVMDKDIRDIAGCEFARCDGIKIIVVDAEHVDLVPGLLLIRGDHSLIVGQIRVIGLDHHRQRDGLFLVGGRFGFRFALRRRFGLLRRGFGLCIRRRLVRRAGGQRKHHQRSQQQCDHFFHSCCSPFIFANISLCLFCPRYAHNSDLALHAHSIRVSAQCQFFR